jgi:hypothetical protein
MANNANTRVPKIKPACTAVVIELSASAGRCHWLRRSSSTALPANHTEVAVNWEKIMVGRIQRECEGEGEGEGEQVIGYRYDWLLLKVTDFTDRAEPVFIPLR